MRRLIARHWWDGARMNTVNPASYNRVMLMVLEDTWSGPFIIRVIECYTLNIITGHFTS